jgi:protein-S-isoprenylcysteine O-methyltransferase Ste14
MKPENGEHPLGDAGQLVCVGLFLIIWIGDSFFLRKSTFLSHYVPLFLRLIILGLTLIASVCLFKSGHAVVCHGQRPNGIVSTGAFRYVRHPLYLASLLVYLALTVSTMSMVSFLLLAGIFVFHNTIANYEEKWLEAKFGKEYGTYKEKTGKWFPRIW